MPMDILKKHILFNLAALAAYQLALFVWISSFTYSSENELGFLIFSAFAIAVHLGLAIVYIIYHYVKGNCEKAKAQAISAALVLIVGFSSCIGLPNAM
jgi:hypothetical protein